MKKVATKGLSEALILLSWILIGFHSGSLRGQAVLFDFNTAPVQTSLPIDLTVDGITAHFSATGSGYSIQQCNVLGFTPVGFTGLSIYPNSVFAADLLISFNQPISDFSLLYSPQELGCDDSATMRVTAYWNTTLVGTNTATVPSPGTWPTGTLSCTFPAGFTNVVIHYDHRPPTCQDYGVIFMADNMQVTPANLAVSDATGVLPHGLISPNPISAQSSLSFFLPTAQPLKIDLYDLYGKKVKNLFRGTLEKGAHVIPLETVLPSKSSGIYILTVAGETFSQDFKVAAP